MASGNVGAVYEAVQEVVERRVAIKILHHMAARDRDLVQRFIGEYQLIREVNHPAVVQVLDFGEIPEGSPYVVMEYLDGETLSERLHRAGGRLPFAEALSYAHQMAKILGAFHQKGKTYPAFAPSGFLDQPRAQIAKLGLH